MTAEVAVPALWQALWDLAETFGSEQVGDDVGSHMTCPEADTLAAAVALVDEQAAQAFLRGHAEGDQDEDGHAVCQWCRALLRADPDHLDDPWRDPSGRTSCGPRPDREANHHEPAR